VSLGRCEQPDCGRDAVIVCRFRTLALAREVYPSTRLDHEVVRAWCWPCFACWTDQVRTLARRGIGLGDP